MMSSAADGKRRIHKVIGAIAVATFLTMVVLFIRDVAGHYGAGRRINRALWEYGVILTGFAAWGMVIRGVVRARRAGNKDTSGQLVWISIAFIFIFIVIGHLLMEDE
jgi:hypothetical protein